MLERCPRPLLIGEIGEGGEQQLLHAAAVGAASRRRSARTCQRCRLATSSSRSAEASRNSQVARLWARSDRLAPSTGV